MLEMEDMLPVPSLKDSSAYVIVLSTAFADLHFLCNQAQFLGSKAISQLAQLTLPHSLTVRLEACPLTFSQASAASVLKWILSSACLPWSLWQSREDRNHSTILNERKSNEALGKNR